MRTYAGRVSLAALALALGGCGGGSGGVSSTPPPATYGKMVDVATGNYSFQSAGVTYTGGPSGFSNGSANAFGSGGTIAYNVSSDTFTVTAPGGTSQSFTAANLVNSGSPTAVQFVKTVGTTQDALQITVPLTYAMVTIWNRTDTNTGISTGRIALGGSETLASDVPRTGSATYAAQSGGAASLGGTVYNLTSSTATFTANFASNSVQTSLTLGGSPGGAGPVTNFGTFSGTGTISATGPGFTGTLAGSTASGTFSGAFFGPQGAEMGYGYVLSGSSFSAAGVAIGTKQ
jgi:hypothetical protein